MNEKYIKAYLSTKTEEEVETVEEVVGYYLVNYKDEALKQWKYNLSYSRWKHQTDDEVTKILENIFSK